ncbi:hypothetical protein PLAN_41153 [Planktothrix rubescens CCAP 1459/22]|uniref:Uncharacterized protein n=1 Tax=Planktothrix rubescens CCAP 1459/22 TaxID=329571 RepID=A0A6J7ZQW7_PLARU|nr:hypothetical protein PLAN_41153 [Planktothrix rubescens NIVA-CYA 18]
MIIFVLVENCYVYYPGKRENSQSPTKKQFKQEGIMRLCD